MFLTETDTRYLEDYLDDCFNQTITFRKLRNSFILFYSEMFATKLKLYCDYKFSKASKRLNAM